MVSKACDIIWIACLLLWTTGLAVRTRHGATNSTNVTNVTNVTNLTKPPAKVPLQLSFSALLSSSGGGAGGEEVKVTADEAKLRIMIEETPSARDLGSDLAALDETQPTDRTLVDVAKNVRHEQERFFDERVCFTFDLFPPENMMPSRHRFKHLQRLRAQLGRRGVSLLRLGREDEDDEDDEGNETVEMSKEEMQHMLFLGAMSDIYKVPLQIYDMATLAEGVKNITGLMCRPWRVNQSRSMPVGPMLQALAKTLDTNSEFSSWWMQALEDEAEGKALTELKSLVQRPKGIVTMTSAFEFCVAEKGELLSTESLYRLTYQRLPEDDNNETRTPEMADEVAPGEEVTIFEKMRSTQVLQMPQRANVTLLDATQGVAGGECADLTQGSTGEGELDEELNAEKRLQRINREAAGHWDAGAYDFWNGLKVREVLSSLGTEMGPLKLPLKAARPSFLRHGKMDANSAAVGIPSTFDARKQWPKCNSIGLIRNQGRCGSCWAVAAATVMTDRFCVAAQAGELKLLQGASNASNLEDMQGLSLAPELLVQCDEKNNGCGGGRLDDAWGFLKRHGIPKESCAPYMHCPVPTQRSCSYGWEKRPFVPYGRSSEEKQTEICGGKCADGSKMSFFRVSEAYAVAKPRDVGALQRELLLAGPVEVAFYVFSDFMNYRSGVYFRTPGAYGPLGGHAVRLLGWGIDEELGKKAVDYWLIANSYSPHWGMHGLFKIRRGTNECGIESTPAAGTPDLDLPVKESS